MIRRVGVLLFSVLAVSFAQSQDWITEEVLTQLTEIRQELSALRDEVQSIKTVPNGPGNLDPTFTLPNTRETPLLGDPNAQVVIVEFSDFQCPYCQRHAQQTLPDLKKNYIDFGEIQYTVMDFPLGFHSDAKPSAIAARCAAQQSDTAYWSFHEHFFGSSDDRFTSEAIQNLALTENLNLNIFNSCLDDPTIAAKVDSDMSYGGSMGVSGTPAFFIGIKDGEQLVDFQMLSGAQPYSVFSQVIDRLLNQI